MIRAIAMAIAINAYERTTYKRASLLCMTSNPLSTAPSISLRSRLSSERDSLTVSALACHAAGPGSNLGEDFCTSFFFRVTGL